MDSPWLDRLSPLPKRIEISGWHQVRPDTLAICADPSDLWATRAADELHEHLQRMTGAGPHRAEEPSAQTVIRFISPASRLHAELFEHPLYDDFAYHPGFQAYQVAPLPQGGLVVRGLDAEGAYWGMKTLKQLITADADTLLIPSLHIADGADMEERGIWSQALGTTAPVADLDGMLAHYRAWIDWMSDHKLNLFEVIVVGEPDLLSYRSSAHPELSSPRADLHESLLRELFAYGATRGVRMVPIFTHPELFGFIGKKYPELRAREAIPHHGHQISTGIDFFQPGTREILADIASEVMAILNPRTLCFWLAENSHRALPSAADRPCSEFMREATVFHSIAEQLRHDHPGLRCRILMSQGSFPENLALMRALPQDVQWIYYSGERYGTYNIRLRNPIHRDIAAGAAEGRWISFCNSLRGVPGRPAHLETIQRNIGHAIDAGLKGVGGMSYAFPGDRAALFIAAETSWNRKGRTLPDSLRVLASEAGAPDPRSQAKAYHLYDRASAAQASCDRLSVGQPFGTFSRLACMIDRIATNAEVDELVMQITDALETNELPTLAKAAADVDQALSMAEPTCDPLFIVRCQYLLRVIRCSRAVTQAFYVNCREKSRDMHKGAWGTDFQNALQACVAEIQQQALGSAELFAHIKEAEGWSCTSNPTEPLRQLAAAAAAIHLPSITTSRDL